MSWSTPCWWTSASDSSPADMPARSAPAALPTTGDMLAELTAALGDANEARWVTAAAAGLASRVLVAHLADPMSDSTAEAARSMARRRAGGEPLQYVLGRWAFRTLDVFVDPRVLVPRPETEQVAGFALDELARAERHGGPLVAADLGTGSGVIALSLAAECPRLTEVWATDLSADALDVARSNLDQLTVDDADAAQRVHLVRGSWFRALPAALVGRLTVVVSNPPYVSAAEWRDLDRVVRDHEPHDALVSGPRGLECIEHIVTEAPSWLSDRGSLVVELAPDQADAVGAFA